MQTKLIKCSNVLFWYIGLPLLAMISIRCFFNHTNPLDSGIFFIAFVFCLPKMYFKHEEMENKSFNNMVNQFREMTTLEFLEAEVTISKMIPRTFRIVAREAYEIVYRERYGS